MVEFLAGLVTGGAVILGNQAISRWIHRQVALRLWTKAESSHKWTPEELLELWNVLSEATKDELEILRDEIEKRIQE